MLSGSNFDIGYRLTIKMVAHTIFMVSVKHTSYFLHIIYFGFKCICAMSELL